MVEAQEVEALRPSAKMHDPGLVGMQTAARAGPGSPRPGRRACFGPFPGGHRDDEVVAIADQHPQSPSRLAHASSRTWRAMLASRGETGEPCGVPASVSETTPPSNTPARSQPRSSFNIRRSDTRRSTSAISASWSMLSKHALMSASSTHPPPRLAAMRTASRAWWAERFGRNPKLTGREVGLEDRLEHDLRCRHDHPVARPWGCRAAGSAPGLPGLGMCTRRSGCGPIRTGPQLLRRARRGRLAPLDPPGLDVGDADAVDPGGAWLAATSTHARHITSLRATLSKRAWNRRVRSCLALRYEHTLKSSNGVQAIGLPDGPSRYLGTHQRSSLQRRASMKQGPFARGGLCCPARRHYYDPLRLPLGCRPLPGVTGYRTGTLPSPQDRGRGGPLQFPRQPSDRSTSPTPEGSSAPAPGSLVPSMAFAKSTQARLPPCPAHGGKPSRRCRLRFMLRTGQLLHPASTPASQPTPGASLPGTLASPRTGLSPAGCRELVARLRHDNLLAHGARAAGRTPRQVPP